MMDVDWAAIFVPQHSLLEFLLRGTIMYRLIFVMLRIVLRRQVGGISTSDVLRLHRLERAFVAQFSPSPRHENALLPR